MKNNENSPVVVPPSQGQIFDIQSAVNAGWPKNLGNGNAQNIIGKKGEFTNDIRKVFSKYINLSPEDQAMLEWIDFYRDNFNSEINPEEIKIPEKKQGHNRLLVIAKGLTINRAYDKCSLKLLCSDRKCDFDNILYSEHRGDSYGSYAIWVRDKIEPNEKYGSTMGYGLNQNFESLTLLERLLLELKFYIETGEHLNVNNITVCEGSEASWSRNPHVIWRNGKFQIRLKAPSMYCYFPIPMR